MAQSTPTTQSAQLARYPVAQGDGSTRTQLVLVTSAEDGGVVRGIPLGYEDEAAHFQAADFATD